MPIREIPGEIEVETTHMCNWNCPYCAIRVHSLPQITEEELRKKIESIAYGKKVTISGGEPGLLRREIVEWMISELKSKDCTLFLNTNGTFIRNFPDLLGNFLQHE